jgi:UDP-glucose 4-epimerase
MGKKIVTGAAGFIGSHLVESLLIQGETTTGIDNFNDYYDPKIKQRNIEHFKNHPNFELIDDDILSLNWSELLNDADIVYHQAAQAGVRASWGSGFRNYTERNINTTQVILEAAKEAPGLKRFVYASSSSVYGNAETFPTSEAVCPQPVSPYGITKLAGESLCSLYYQNFGLPCVSLRYFTVYGPRQRPDMAFHKFFKLILAGKPINIYGDGKQTRDFTFIGDAIAANLAAGKIPEAVGHVFNIGGGSRMILTEVIDIMEGVVGTPIQTNFTEKAKGDARHTSADISKAQAILGYQPKVCLEEGLKQEWKWLSGS